MAAKRTQRGSASKKVNKSAWIRGQPAGMSAKDVVAKAKGQGIKLSISQVYTARSSAKKRAGTAGTAGRAPRYSGASNAGDEAAFRRLVVAIGVRRADELLADFKRSVGL